MFNLIVSIYNILNSLRKGLQMPIDNTPYDSLNKLGTQEERYEINTLHEQLKKIKEESDKVIKDANHVIKDSKDIDDSVNSYCS